MKQTPESYLKRVDPLLGKVITRIDLQPIPQCRTHFQTLVEAIISQQLSDKAAMTIVKRFQNLFPVSRFPTAKQVLSISPKKIRSAGLSLQKVSFIRDLARRIDRGELDFRKLRRLSDEEAIAVLVIVRGVGRWTAEMFLMFSLGREDIFSAGDLGIQKAMQKLYGRRRIGERDFQRMQKIAERWRPYRTYACRYLWASLAFKKDS